MKKVIAVILCSIVISAWGASNTTLNDQVNNVSTTSKGITSTASTTKTNVSNTVKPSTLSKTNIVAAVTNNTTTSTTAVPKTTSNVIYIPETDPKSYKWILNGTNSSIIIRMAVRFNIMYFNSTSKQNLSMVIDLPANNETQVDGSFGLNDETLILSWKSTGSEPNSLSIHFKRNKNTYIINDIEVLINPKDIPDDSNSTMKFVNTKEHFNTSIGNSYRCVKLQNFNLTRENNNSVAGYMIISDLQFQAFKTDKQTSFGFAEDCALDTPDVVPIAVGCVLAGLVIIVLAAYLISRRRSEARGYLSM